MLPMRREDVASLPQTDSGAPCMYALNKDVTMLEAAPGGAKDVVDDKIPSSSPTPMTEYRHLRHPAQTKPPGHAAHHPKHQRWGHEDK